MRPCIRIDGRNSVKDVGNDFDPSLTLRFVIAGTIAALFLLVDQVSKSLVRSQLMGHAAVDFIPGVLRLQFCANTGAAFSLGEGFGGAFALIAVLVTLTIVWYLARTPRIALLEAIGMGMVVGGAAGNAIDRVVHGFVTDFFATVFIDFPVFNVADIGITVGVVLAFIGFMFFSPASHVDATAELNRRDAERMSHRERKGDSRDSSYVRNDADKKDA